MKIALASSPVITRDISHNISSILQAMEQCSQKADLVVFGESALQGFDCLSWDYETDCRMAVSLDDPRIIQICEAAKQSEIAVSFGYIEKSGDALYSSQVVIDSTGSVIYNFRRVSVGWKEYWYTDDHYREGESFESFSLGEKKFSIALCGDLWTEGRPEEMRCLNTDIVLWPVWCDYNAQSWNEKIKFEYARQAALCGNCVLYVNPFCADQNVTDAARGGAVCFRNGIIEQENAAGRSDILFIEI